jgi:hypothetical protein
VRFGFPEGGARRLRRETSQGGYEQAKQDGSVAWMTDDKFTSQDKLRLTLVEKLVGAKSFDSAIRMQSEYAKTVFRGLRRAGDEDGGTLFQPRQGDFQAVWSGDRTNLYQVAESLTHGANSRIGPGVR